MAGVALATSTCTLRGRHGTCSHQPWFCVAGVALVALGWLDIFVLGFLFSAVCQHMRPAGLARSSCTCDCFPLIHHTVLTHAHTTIPHTTLPHTMFHTRNLVTHNLSHTHTHNPQLYHTHLSHTTLSHTTLHIQLL